MAGSKEGLSYTIGDQFSATARDQLKVATYQKPKGRLSYTIGEHISPEQYEKLQEIVNIPKNSSSPKEIYPLPKTQKESISSRVQEMFDRFPGYVGKGEIEDELIMGKTLLVVRKKEGDISEIHMRERSDGTEKNYLSQEISIVFDSTKQPRVELTEVGLEMTTVTLEYGYVNGSGDVSVEDNVIVRSNYWGDGSGISDDGISMYSFSEKSLQFLSGIELSAAEDQDRNELIIRDDPYVEDGVRFPLRKINVYEALQSFEKHLESGGNLDKGVFHL